MVQVLLKDQQQEMWKDNMKEFAEGNDDALFSHNATGQYRVANIEEFLQQADLFQESIPSLRLLEGNIKHFKYKNNKYVFITLNSEEEDFQKTDGNHMSGIAFALNYCVFGYSYLFKKKSYKKIEEEIKSRFIKYEICETGKCKVCGGNATSSLLGLFAVCENCD